MNFRGKLRHLLQLVVLLTVPILGRTSASTAELENQYGNKVLTMRGAYPGASLQFDPDGKPMGTVAPGAWTVDAQLRVEKISLKDGVLHIRGQRLFLFYDTETRQLRDVGAVKKDDKASKYFRTKIDKWDSKMGKTAIEVECGKAQPEMADVIKAMNAVFVAPDEPPAAAVPDFWRAWLERKQESTRQIVNPTTQEANVARVGRGVSPPHATYAPDPEYSEVARQAKYQATTVLWLVVGADGMPRNIRISRPAGMGLDEQAVKAVQTWRFDPAKKDGSPVAVQINVEVNFTLY
jgi:TonB family protein